jgi:hypothetical protein
MIQPCVPNTINMLRLTKEFLQFQIVLIKDTYSFTFLKECLIVILFAQSLLKGVNKTTKLHVKVREYYATTKVKLSLCLTN